jgi:hypothetical protein
MELMINGAKRSSGFHVDQSAWGLGGSGQWVGLCCSKAH